MLEKRNQQQMKEQQSVKINKMDNNSPIQAPSFEKVFQAI